MQSGQPQIWIAKLLVLVAWLVAAAGFFFPASSTFGNLGRLLFLLLVVVHAVECVFFLPRLRRTGRPLPLELLQVLLFGVVHYGEVKALLENAPPDEPTGDERA